jgi:hypothetical protein
MPAKLNLLSKRDSIKTGFTLHVRFRPRKPISIAKSKQDQGLEIR